MEEEHGKTKKITVTFDDEVTEYERVIISGKEIGDAHVNTTFMYGFSDFDKFINDFSNILITSAQFIVNESNADREKVVETLRDICDSTFIAYLDGDFDREINDADYTE